MKLIWGCDLSTTSSDVDAIPRAPPVAVCNNPWMPTYRLTLEYEGTRYHGWQEQKNARSVAGELRKAVEEAGAVVKDLGGSGRTDAGVHALAQVAHLRLARAVDPEAFRRAVNEVLPPDVHVLAMAPVSDKFH